MRHVIGPIRGATRKVHQVTGENDRERGVPCPNRTESRFGIFGTDLGASFEHEGNLWFLFGDTVSSVGYDNLLRPEAGDSLAFSADTDPENGLTLQFLTAPDGHYLSPLVEPEIPRGPFDVPLDGFSAGGHMYVWFSTDADPNAPGGALMGRSVLTRLADVTRARFTHLYDLSVLRDGGKFINVSCTVINNATAPGLPDSTGQGLVIFGSGAYRHSDPYLAYLPLANVEQRGAVRYYAGGPPNAPRWSTREREAVPLFDHPQIGELSVRFCPEIRGWLMLYNAGDPRGINLRVAPAPWGPWSATAVVFDPWCDGGYTRFMHASYRDNGRADTAQDPGRDDEWAGEYGPYLIPRFTRRDGSDVVIYFLMSTWNPYNTVLMRAKLRVDPWDGFQLAAPGSAATSGAITAVSRIPGSMEVWWVGADGSVQDRYWYDNATWQGFELARPGSASTGGGITSVSRIEGSMEVWWVGPRGSIEAAFWYETGSWQRYQLSGPGSAAVTSPITSVSRTPGSMEVWWIGADGSVQDRYWYDNATWQGFELAGPGSAATGGGIAAVSRIPGSMEVWWIGADGSIQDRYWYDSAAWQGFELAGPGSAATGGGIAAVSRIPGSLELWWIGPDGSVQGAFWYDTGTWQRYELAGPGSASVTSPLTALARIPGSMEVWWIGPAGSVEAAFWYDTGAWHRYQRAAPGSASPTGGITSVSRIPGAMEIWYCGAAGSIEDCFWYA